MTYEFLQSYWWFLVSLLGALLVFLMFVQGANTLIFCLGKTEEERRLIINSTGRKWEFTFTTLVTFGGAFFASFPLFYSTSFGGAYWVWMLILACFVLQAVSYEYQSKKGNLLGKKTYQVFLLLNGILGPILLGTAVGTFFSGAEFVVNKGQLTDVAMPVISSNRAAVSASVCVPHHIASEEISSRTGSTLACHASKAVWYLFAPMRVAMSVPPTPRVRMRSHSSRGESMGRTSLPAGAL